jgi:hypothetical protein
LQAAKLRDHVSDHFGLAGIVSDENRRGPLGGENPAELEGQSIVEFGIETGEGLIEKQNSRSRRQSPSQRYPFRLTS